MIELAKKLIRLDVQRGHTIKQLKSGQMGMTLPNGFGQIGGWVKGKKYTTDNIIIEVKEEVFIYKLKKVFDEVSKERIKK